MLLLARWVTSSAEFGPRLSLGLLWSIHAWGLAAFYASSLLLLLETRYGKQWPGAARLGWKDGAHKLPIASTNYCSTLYRAKPLRQSHTESGRVTGVGSLVDTGCGEYVVAEAIPLWTG